MDCPHSTVEGILQSCASGGEAHPGMALHITLARIVTTGMSMRRVTRAGIVQMINSARTSVIANARHPGETT